MNNLLTARLRGLAARSTVWGTGRRFDRRFALVAAASRGRLAVRGVECLVHSGQCADAPRWRLAATLALTSASCASKTRQIDEQYEHN
jgi:hypothetical protein